MSIENERRFLLKSLPPNLNQYPKVNITQGYLAVEEKREIRLRDEDGKYSQTMKIGSGQARQEFAYGIPKEQFDLFWPNTEGRRVRKVRYLIPYRALTLELAVYFDNLKGFMAVEVEFKTDEDAKNFLIPHWFGEEVTLLSAYKDKSLAIHGKPLSYRVDPNFLLEVDKALISEVKIPEFDLSPGLENVNHLIEKYLELGKENFVVAVAGGSASGKTSAVADKIYEQFKERAIILSMDDYYRGRAALKEDEDRGEKINWDQPEALDLGLLKENLMDLKAGKEIDKPIYSFKTGEREGFERVGPKQIVVLEGLFALDSFLADVSDFRVYVEIGTYGRMLRRLLRDVKRTSDSPAKILRYFMGVVEPMHEKYIDSTKKNASIIIRNEYNATIEAKRSGLSERQVKVKVVEFDFEKLREINAEILTSVHQVDYYYNPKDRDLAKTDEMLRVRREGENWLLTYKGPKEPNFRFRERSKFEFEIDEEIAGLLIGVYGKEIKRIIKERRIYQYKDVVITCDRVHKLEDKYETFIGNFIEFRLGENAGILFPQIFMTSYGLSNSSGYITKSYCEM